MTASILGINHKSVMSKVLCYRYRVIRTIDTWARTRLAGGTGTSPPQMVHGGGRSDRWYNRSCEGLELHEGAPK